MDELTDIYKRIEYLRNNGVKMKEIADRVDMAPSVLSALYSSVLPAYIDLLKTRTPDEADIRKELKRARQPQWRQE